jgi:hypothetical protein
MYHKFHQEFKVTFSFRGTVAEMDRIIQGVNYIIGNSNLYEDPDKRLRVRPADTLFIVFGEESKLL